MATAALDSKSLFPSIPTANPPAIQPAAEPVNRILNQYVMRMPDASSHATWATVWRVAAIASLVAYVILATLAILLTGIYEPLFLPVVTTLALRCIDDALRAYAYFIDFVSIEHVQAKFEENIEEQLKLLPTNEGELVAKLKTLLPDHHYDESLEKISNPVELRFVFARYMALRIETTKMADQAKNIIAKANSDTLFEARLDSVVLFDRINTLKIQMAYLRGLALNRYLPGSVHDVYQLVPRSTEGRLMTEALLARFQDKNPCPDPFVTFKATATSLTTEEVGRMNIPQISAEMFRAPNGTSTG